MSHKQAAEEEKIDTCKRVITLAEGKLYEDRAALLNKTRSTAKWIQIQTTNVRSITKNVEMKR